jgi:hypothetical protein
LAGFRVFQVAPDARADTCEGRRLAATHTTTRGKHEEGWKGGRAMLG